MNDLEKLERIAVIGRYECINLYDKEEYVSYSRNGSARHTIMFLFSTLETENDEERLENFANLYRGMKLYYVRNYATKRHNIIALPLGGIVRINRDK